jgi:uncharacterized surface protein with fasciclin (FAS1) repeats
VKRLFLKAAAVAAAGVLLKACGGGGGGGGSGGSGGGGGGGGGGGNCQAAGSNDTLLQRLEQDGRFSALLAAFNKAGLADTLNDRAADLTLLAPDNDAFDRLGARIGRTDRNGLVAGLSAAQWGDILRFSLMPQRLSSCDLTPPAGQDLRPNTLYTQPTGDVAQLIFLRDNGGPLTILGRAGANATLAQSDLDAVNGVMHVPSDVVLPAYVLTLSEMLRSSVDSSSGFAQRLTTQVPELSGTGSFTVFVPIDGSFTPPLSAAQQRRHVVSGLVRSNDFTDGRTLTPLSGGGGPLTLRLNGAGNDTINGTEITDVDFFGSNGVIHVVRGVIT